MSWRGKCTRFEMKQPPSLHKLHCCRYWLLASSFFKIRRNSLYVWYGWNLMAIPVQGDSLLLFLSLHIVCYAPPKRNSLLYTWQFTRNSSTVVFFFFLDMVNYKRNLYTHAHIFLLWGLNSRHLMIKDEDIRQDNPFRSSISSCGCLKCCQCTSFLHKLSVINFLYESVFLLDTSFWSLALHIIAYQELSADGDLFCKNSESFCKLFELTRWYW